MEYIRKQYEMRFHYTPLIFFVGYFLLSSCQYKKTAEDLKKIRQGMSKTQVDSLMGSEFDIINDYFDSSIFQQVYSNSIISADDYRIYFSKEDSVVVDVWYGE